MFVAYGKDRVSFTYELAARGFVLVVQPEAFVVHHRTPAPERAAGIRPRAAMPVPIADGSGGGVVDHGVGITAGGIGGSRGGDGSGARNRAVSYGHAPEAWMVGETCWPDFENRVRIKYNFREGWCLQTSIGHAVNLSVVNSSLVCISQAENLCVLNCRPTTVTWHGRGVASHK